MNIVELFKQEAEKIEKTYYNPNIPTGGGITATEMLRRMERAKEIIAPLEKELRDAANKLIEEHNVPVTDQLKEEIKEIAMGSLRRATKANTTGLG